ncbi:hypothetical protein SEA_LITTLELAF_33 [Mycobacterium phage LittleLaf]|uniref:Terminase small subunit n=8 Tax=Marvinvirus TaxID=1982091 RepID=A0A3S9U8Z7_9CAUD|nr:hypothetical protein SEA_GATTACA_32 [Mycobacterium phage Gattaca]AVE00778.1 hypothetical protein SEA_TESLA_32 [Mycobacterium phage Tesla]AYB69839.1 hypothetical protein SEA_LITTLELAF_33 [Mycobacterium phage LittleLaf]AYB70669.1 hypothetical protein SEA_VASUNZINGA_33 [Mycobacterium phage VasuNzinga]AZS06797.1 hypothetical protein SEA_RAELA_33 [Mycobacterium phage Raela]QAX93084.1 hypothetical protein SEA_REDRAIDER77_33 [Mycobacterium phage RedRaider77]QFP96896.1 hypothetical protein SEA_PRI
MAGHGPPPKPADQRARGKRSDVIPLRVLTQDEPAEQPLLPADIDWHPQTIAWWHLWRESPLSRDFTTVDWAYLLETAMIHTRFWQGDTKAAAELRLRMANFGSTPADRARLRIQIVTAIETEDKAAAKGNVPQSRQRYAPPKVG